MKITFVSTDSDFIRLANRKNYNTFNGNIKDYYPPPDTTNLYFISFSNSLNFMDKGVPRMLSYMFKGVESKINMQIRNLGHKNKFNRYYLPIGQSLLTETDLYTTKGRQYVISSPVTLSSSDVSDTPNLFIAMSSVIKMLKNSVNTDKNDELILYPVGFGYNNETCLQQFEDALNQNTEKLPLFNKLQQIMQLQPEFYEQAEWFGVNPLGVAAQGGVNPLGVAAQGLYIKPN